MTEDERKAEREFSAEVESRLRGGLLMERLYRTRGRLAADIDDSHRRHVSLRVTKFGRVLNVHREVPEGESWLVSLEQIFDLMDRAIDQCKEAYDEANSIGQARTSQ